MKKSPPEAGFFQVMSILFQVAANQLLQQLIPVNADNIKKLFIGNKKSTW